MICRSQSLIKSIRIIALLSSLYLQRNISLCIDTMTITMYTLNGCWFCFRVFETNFKMLWLLQFDLFNSMFWVYFRVAPTIDRWCTLVRIKRAINSKQTYNQSVLQAMDHFSTHYLFIFLSILLFIFVVQLSYTYCRAKEVVHMRSQHKKLQTKYREVYEIKCCWRVQWNEYALKIISITTRSRDYSCQDI